MLKIGYLWIVVQEWYNVRGKEAQISSRNMTSFRRHVPTRFLINQCQIITFLILKSDIIENSRIIRIELRGIVSIVSTFKSN